jgi:predicted nucleic acid-binding protein
MSVVLDASAGIDFALGRLSAEQISEIARADIAVPSLYVTEVGTRLARFRANGELSSDEADAHRLTAIELPDDIVPDDQLADDAWAMTRNLSGYDAIYVALAVRRGAALWTSDGPLSRHPDPPCIIRLLPAAASRPAVRGSRQVTPPVRHTVDGAADDRGRGGVDSAITAVGLPKSEQDPRPMTAAPPRPCPAPPSSRPR